MKRVISLTFIITIVFWAVASSFVVSASSVTFSLPFHLNSLIIQSTGRVNIGERDLIYNDYSVPVPSGYDFQYIDIPYYYRNDITIDSSSDFQSLSSFFRLDLRTDNFSLPVFFGDHVFKFSTFVLSAGRSYPYFSLYGSYNDGESVLISGLHTSTYLGDVYYSDNGYGDFSYRLYSLNVLVSLDDFPKSYDFYDDSGTFISYPFDFYYFSSTVGCYFFPNYTVYNDLAGLSYNYANELGTYNICHFPYISVTVDFDYSATYEDAVYKLQQEVKDTVTAAGTQISNTIINVYGEIDPAVIEKFEEAFNETHDKMDDLQSQENAAFSAADSAVAELSEFDINAGLAGAGAEYVTAYVSSITVWEQLSSIIFEHPYILFMIGTILTAALIYFIISGKVK